MYYEAWGIRGHSSQDYRSLQIGHATSRDGLHWTKDPANPVLPKGSGNAWDLSRLLLDHAEALFTKHAVILRQGILPVLKIFVT